MLKFVADENIHNQIILNLRRPGLNVISIKESYPGISDIEIIETILDDKSVLLTEDSDFGKWVFVYKKQMGVIYLRYLFQGITIFIFGVKAIFLYNFFFVNWG